MKNKADFYLFFFPHQENFLQQDKKNKVLYTSNHTYTVFSGSKEATLHFHSCLLCWQFSYPGDNVRLKEFMR